MIHPSYSELMNAVNEDSVNEEQPVVNSRYSIVLATSKRARQLIAGDDTLLDKDVEGVKPLSVAVEELYSGKVKILSNTDEEIEEIAEEPVAEIQE